jgi:hypothetical protein
MNIYWLLKVDVPSRRILIESAKANGIDPYAYIKYILDHIADEDTPEKLDALLPWNTP